MTTSVPRNAVALLASEVANRAGTLAVYVLVGRALGAEAFGRLALAFVFLYAGQVLASGGLRPLLTREISRAPSAAARYGAAGMTVTVPAAVLVVAGVHGLVEVLDYAPETARAVGLLSWALLPYACTAVFESVFQAQERMDLVAAVTVPAAVVKVGVIGGLLSAGGDLPAVVAGFVGFQLLVAVLEALLLVRRVPWSGPGPARPRARVLVGRASPFLGVDVLVAVASSSSVVLLSVMRDEQAVGVYAAASQLVVPMALVSYNVVLAAYPAMCRRFGEDADGLRQVASSLASVLLLVAVPVAVLLVLLAGRFLHLLYDDSPLAGGQQVLALMAPTVVLGALSAVFGQVLYAMQRERTNLSITVVEAVVSVVLGAALIARSGAEGAAAATLLVRSLSWWLHWRPVRPLVPAATLGGLLAVPAIASLALGGAVVLLPRQPLLLSLTAGLCAYVITAVLVQRLAARSRSARAAASGSPT